MTAAIEAMQRKEHGQSKNVVTDSFQVVLCIDDAQGMNEWASVLRRLGAEVVTVVDIGQALDVVAATEFGLAIYSFGFSGRRIAELISSHHELGGGLPFAFWTPDAVANLEDVVTAMRSGAVDVIHGSPSDSKLESLLEEAQRANGRQHQRLAVHGHQRSAEVVAATKSACLSNGSPNGNGASKGHAGDVDREDYPSPKMAARVNGREATHHVVCRTGSPNGQCDESQILQKIRGRSSAMEAIRNVIRHVAPTQATVMIHGESGTGKELVARAIHSLSKRCNQSFVPVNMAAIPNGLAESFLFGHEKGAFTSAVQKQKGWCRVAHGGTLFLDEIGEMELEIQPKLLRFLQEGSIQTVGAQTVEKVDVRLVTATNQDPREIVREGRLREDLFFRLNVIPIYIPPLRDRCDDIEELAMLFLERAAERHERPVKGYTGEAMEVLVRHDWPGNVRQLENMVERLVIFAKGELVDAMEVPAEIHTPSRRRHFNPVALVTESHNGNGHSTEYELNHVDNVIDRLSPFQVNERTVIIDALQRADGHVIRAAQLLGLGQATMYRKIKQYVIPHQRKRRKAAPR